MDYHTTMPDYRKGITISELRLMDFRKGIMISESRLMDFEEFGKVHLGINNPSQVLHRSHSAISYDTLKDDSDSQYMQSAWETIHQYAHTQSQLGFCW